MANIYNFLKIAYHGVKQENKDNPTFIFVVLILLTIPLALIASSISLGLLLVTTVIYFKKSDFKLDKNLLLPVALYLLMLLSVFWTIDFDRTTTAVLKQIPLLIIPLCFLCFQSFTESQKTKIIQCYSYGIALFSVFYLLKAIIRFTITQNVEVFFYHELVSKEVNAIHVSVYVAIAFFYFFIKPIKKYWIMY